jgi:hypothetical protein
MRRHLAVLLLLYVTLDFANPLMPGAVRFEAGTIEVVQAGGTVRPARLEAVPAPLLVRPPAWTGAPGGVALARLVPVSPPAPTVAFRTVRRTPPRVSAPRPSSDDH